MDNNVGFAVCIFGTMLLLPLLLQKDVMCPNCFHLEYKLRNVPPFLVSLVELMLLNLKWSLPACASNHVVPTRCNKPLIPFLIENKCTTVKMELRAIGMKSILPDAEMDVIVVIRACQAVMYGTPDKCMQISELGEEEREEITKTLKLIETHWTLVTFSGTVCTKTP